MNFNRLVRYLTAILMVGVNLWNFVVNDYAWPVVSKDGAYLMVYFVGNEPEQQRLHFAVSEDGYNFAALNDNEAVITQTLGTKCVRDPYILKAKDENGTPCYYIVATDMDAMQGWVSNHSIIFWKSYDLVNWEDEFVLDMRDFEGWEGCNRAWAPQIIYDETVGKYMVYLALSTWDDPATELNEDNAQHYYMYTEDFKTFTSPEYLYGRRGEVTPWGFFYKVTHPIPWGSTLITKSLCKGVCVCALVAQSCPTLCESMDHSPPASSVHGILQARILEWLAISFPRGSS